MVFRPKCGRCGHIIEQKVYTLSTLTLFSLSLL